MSERCDFSNGLVVIDIPLYVELPANANLRMLFMQPDVHLVDTLGGYRWIDSSTGTLSPKQKQLQNIANLMDLAKNYGVAGLFDPIDFVLIPEYCIPGITGLDQIICDLSDDTPQKQIVIGGIDGLTRDEFLLLLDRSSFEDELKIAMEEWIKQKPINCWINTAVIIEKFGNDVRFFLQPKLLRSPDGETGNQMLEGSWVLLFHTQGNPPIKFIISVCFDWIGINQDINKLDEICRKLPANHVAAEYWIAFVPQCNRKPRKFLGQARHFLQEEPWKMVHGRNAATVMVNVATNDEECGETAIVFSNWPSVRRQECNSNFEPCNTYTMLPRSEIGNCFEARFRKNRAAIHAAEVVLPLATNDTSGEDHYPIRLAVVHTINGQLRPDDPRYPNPPSPVCAYKKALCEYLDYLKESSYYLQHLSPTMAKNMAMNYMAEEWDEYLSWDKNLTRNVFKQLCRWVGYRSDCDSWKLETEGKAFNQLSSTRLALNSAKINVDKPSRYHGYLSLGATQCELLVANLNSSSDRRKLFFNIFSENLDNTNFGERLIVVYGDEAEGAHFNTPPLMPRFTETGSASNRYTQAAPRFIDFREIMNQLSETNSLLEFRPKLKRLLGG